VDPFAKNPLCESSEHKERKAVYRVFRNTGHKIDLCDPCFMKTSTQDLAYIKPLYPKRETRRYF